MIADRIGRLNVVTILNLFFFKKIKTHDISKVLAKSWEKKNIQVRALDGAYCPRHDALCDLIQLM